MLEPPSAELMQRLQAAGLCTPRDIRRARSRVRRLTHDLPAFDSVWIDAWIQLGKLTPFQGRVLESDSPDRLRLGSQVLVDQLARGVHSATYRVKAVRTGRPAIAKWIPLKAPVLQQVRDCLEKFLDQSRRVPHSHLVLANSVETVADGLVVLSPIANGESLADLLVRRGRFPAEAVWQIGRQLLAALADLHAVGLSHGELRLANIRLGSDGRCRLVDAGIRSAVSPQVSIHLPISLEDCDTLAPERIGTGKPSSASSDLYSLGCVLWQLLTGRPTVLSADSLAKMAAHQTTDVADPRQFAPETPPELAEGILWLTNRKPQARPQSASELLDRWGKPGFPGRQLLKRFLAQFEHPVPLLAGQPSVPSSAWPRMIVAIVLVAALVFGLWERGLKSQLLSVSDQITTLAHQTFQKQNGDDSALKPGQLPDGRFELPKPSAEGVITLEHAGPFAPTEIAQVGPLAIRAKTGVCPVIRIIDQPLKVVAQQLTLENVQLQFQPAEHASEPPRSLLMIEAQAVHLVNSAFHAGMLETEDGASAPLAVAWKLFDRRDALGGQLTVKNCLCTGSGGWFYAEEAPQSVRLDNCLKVGRGPLMTLGQTPGSGTLRLQLRRVTLRETSSLIRVRGPLVERNAGSRMELEMDDCILALAGQSHSVIEFFGERLRPDWNKALTITGDGSLAREATELLAWKSQKTLEETPLESASISLEGLVLAPFEFRGPASIHPVDAVVKSFQAPRRSLFPPGIDADSFSPCTSVKAPAIGQK